MTMDTTAITTGTMVIMAAGNEQEINQGWAYMIMCLFGERAFWWVSFARGFFGLRLAFDEFLLTTGCD